MAKTNSGRTSGGITGKGGAKINPVYNTPASNVKVVPGGNKASRVSKNNAEYLRVAAAAGLGDGKTGVQTVMEKAMRDAKSRQHTGETQNLIKIKGDLPSKAATSAALAEKKAAQAALRASKAAAALRSSGRGGMGGGGLNINKIR